MITNATILRIDRASAGGPTGEIVYTRGDSIEVDCFSAPYDEQKYRLGATIKDASDTIYASIDDLLEVEDALNEGDRVLVRFDEETASVLMQVLAFRTNRHGSVSHFELFTKRV